MLTACVSERWGGIAYHHTLGDTHFPILLSPRVSDDTVACKLIIPLCSPTRSSYFYRFVDWFMFHLSTRRYSVNKATTDTIQEYKDTYYKRFYQFMRVNDLIYGDIALSRYFSFRYNYLFLIYRVSTNLCCDLVQQILDNIVELMFRFDHYNDLSMTIGPHLFAVMRRSLCFEYTDVKPELNLSLKTTNPLSTLSEEEYANYLGMLTLP